MNHSARSELLSLLDLTTLNESDSEASVRSLLSYAHTELGSVAAVCIYPQFVALAQSVLQHSCLVATVVNFPEGNRQIATVLSEVAAALALGADEIDLVIPYQDCLKGDMQGSVRLVQEAKALMGKHTLKVIVESGAFKDENSLYHVSLEMLQAGADFIKTSTGKIPKGASLNAAKVMLEAIYAYYQKTGHWRGFKASGGIRTLDEAAQYLALAHTICGKQYIDARTLRFGASSLLNAILGITQSSTY